MYLATDLVFLDNKKQRFIHSLPAAMQGQAYWTTNYIYKSTFESDWNQTGCGKFPPKSKGNDGKWEKQNETNEETNQTKTNLKGLWVCI